MLVGPPPLTRRAALQAIRPFSNLASLSYSSHTELSDGQNIPSIRSLCKKGHVEEALEYLLCKLTNPPLDAYLVLLKACIAKQSLHTTLFVYTNLTLHVSHFYYVLGDYLVVALAKCGAVDDAYHTSCTLPRRTVFSWTAIISACVDRGRAQDALKMHLMMEDDGVEPNEFTYASLLKACGILRDLQTGKQLHDDVRRKGLASFYFVGNTLVSMYGKCGAIADAVDAFISLPQHGVVAWNAMLAAFVEQDLGEDALLLYRTMQELHVDPDQLSLTSALQACGILVEKGEDSAVEAQSTRAICQEIVQALHSNARKEGFMTNIYVGTTLVCMYGKVGIIEEAENVFTAMPVCNIVSWNAMLLAYIEQGKGRRALQFYRLMLEKKMDPDHHTYATALKACYMLADEESSDMEGTCSKALCLEIGEAIYNDAKKKDLASDTFISTSLLSVYGRCGATSEAETLLGLLSHRNVVSWTAMLSAYLSGDQPAKALQSYGCMIEEGVKPDQQALVIAIQACSTLGGKEVAMAADGQWKRAASQEIGQGLHAAARKMGLALDVFVGSSLVSMYGKVGSILEAECTFCRLSRSSVVAWTAMLSVYVEQGQGVKALQLYRHMHEQGVNPDEQALLAALQACGSFLDNRKDDCSIKLSVLEIVQALHDDVWKMGYASDAFITSNLLIVYGKCGSITDAEFVFSRSLQQSVVSWSAMASCLVQQGDGERALQLYRDLQRDKMAPDALMLAIAIQACRTLRPSMDNEEKSVRCVALEIGQALHADARKRSLVSDSEVGKSLVIFYSELGTLEEAESTFITLPKNNPESWNAMLAAYVSQGQGQKALQLFTHMQEEGLDPDTGSFALAVQACGMLGDNEEMYFIEGTLNKTVCSKILRALHADAHRKGFTSDAFAGNTILNMYGRCGAITEAEEVFGTLSNCRVSSWNAMLSAYINQGLVDKALKLFGRMQLEHVLLDEITILCTLQACSETGNLTLCQELHIAVVAAGHDVNSLIVATLIYAYGKCARTVDGQSVFKGLVLPHLASWTACIAGHTGKHHSEDGLMCFEELQHIGVKLDGTTFTSVFAACSHAGLIVEGIELFASIIRDHHIDLDATHYGSLVDLLGRAGDFVRLEDMLWRMPLQADSSIWSSLLGACRVHGNLELAKHAFCHALRLQPKEASMYVTMSNIFAEGVQE